MEMTDDEMFLGRIAAARDSVLCRHMEPLYRSLSREDIYTLWEQREGAALLNNEALLVRRIIREMDDLGRAPTALRIPPSAPVDWWSAPRDRK